MALITTAAREELIALFTAMFRAAPGATNLNAMVAAYESGATTAQIAASLALRTEFQTVYPTLQTADEFAAALIATMLPASTPAGAVTWATGWITGQLAAGKSRAQIITEAVVAIRATTNTNYADAKTLLANKVDVATYYSVTKLQSSTSLATLQDVIDNVTTAASTVTDAKAVINNDAEIAAGQTYTLTVGIDTYTGGAGADIFNAVENPTGAVATISGLDSIDGGAGNDTINVTETTTITIPASAVVKNVETANITSGAAITAADVSTWTGLTKVNAVSIGGSSVTAATTTNVSVTEATQAAAAVSVIGGKDVTIASNGTTTGTNTVNGAVGAVVVNVTGDYDGTGVAAGDKNVTFGAINVTGGTTVNVTQATGLTSTELANAATSAVNSTITQGAVTVTGTSATTKVTVEQAAAVTLDNAPNDGTAWLASPGAIGVVRGAVTINDVNTASTTLAGTINNVSLKNYGATVINSNALSTLTLTGGGGGVTINDNLTTPTVKALDLTVGSMFFGGGTLTDTNDKYTSIAVHVNGTGAFGGATLAGISADSVKSLTVDGNNTFTVTSSAGMSTLETITVSGTAGFTSNNAAGLTNVKSVVSTSTGKVSVTVDDTAVTVTGGAGADTITYTAAIAGTAVVSLGGGDDTLILGAASAAGASINGGDGKDVLRPIDGGFINGAVTYASFEVANLNAMVASNLNMDLLPSVTELTLTAATTGAVVIQNAQAGTNLFVTNNDALSDASGLLNQTTALTYQLKTDTTADALTISMSTADYTLKAVAGKGDNSTAAVTLASVIANDIETLTVTTSATNPDGGTGAGAKTAADYINTITSLTGADLKTIVHTGAASLTITDVTAAALTKVDASAATGALTITLDASANTGAIAVLGGSGDDTVTMTGNVASNNIIVGNGGADDIILAAAGTKETVRYASDTDSVLTLVDTTVPAVTPIVMDEARGVDSITNFVSGEDKIELSSALGLATGDARSAIAGKGIIAADGGADTTAEIAAVLQTLIGTGTGFFNDGTVNRAVAAATYDDTTAAEDFVVVFVDTNADGNFTLGTDQAVALMGITSIVISDIVFG